MLESIFRGSSRYLAWVGFLLFFIAVAGLVYWNQVKSGLGVTGLNQDVLWGLYISQLNFWVGVAASAVAVVVPYYLHDQKAFGKAIVVGESLAISACLMCLLFVWVDIGQPGRIVYVLLYASPKSIMFWDAVALAGYLLINAVLVRSSLVAEQNCTALPSWFRPIAYVSIPWAIGIHTVTAFLYAGLSARYLWNTAILAPRFLASAFASGPSLLVLLLYALKKFAKHDVDEGSILTLARIITYCTLANVFFVGVEVFTAFYGGIQHHTAAFAYLFENSSSLAPWLWASALMTAIALVLLIAPQTRNNLAVLPWACVLVAASVWLDKGLGMVIAGFVPNAYGHTPEYCPTMPEAAVSVGICAFGLLITTFMCKIIVNVRERAQ